MTAFVRVVEAGSFSKAGVSMGVPKPTITRLVQALEAQLQVKLLHRSTRSLTLTSEGAAYYERAVHLLAELDDIEMHARDSLARPSGRIKVELSVAMATMVIVPALVDFRKKFPNITIELSVSNRDADIVAEGIDCAIRAGFLKDQSLVARRIGRFRFATYASPSYIAAVGEPMHPRELGESHHTVGMVSMRKNSPTPFRFYRGAERFEVNAHHLLIDDTNAYVAAAITGFGVIQAASFATESAVKAGLLVPLLTDWQSDVYEASVVYSPNRYLSAKVRVFVDWVIELFEKHQTLR